MSQASDRLLKIDDSISSAEIATMIADYLLESDRLPYAFSIDHNVGPPHYRACPLRYDWKLGKTVGIETENSHVARQWLVEAAMNGFIVSRVDRKHKPDGPSNSIERARSRANTRRFKFDDDDIPF
jgi:hypothetical protein